MTVRVKICGITRVDDALLAARLGADAVGLNLWPGSPRFVTAERAREIVAALPPFVTAVGVFVNQPAAEVGALARSLRLSAVQLHGDEAPAELRALPVSVIKALRLTRRDGLAALAAYPAQAFLLDAACEGFGGSGRTCDWALAREAAERATVVLAGGLGPDNVAAAVRAVRPWAVDVASGVESSPGVKDPDKLARFVERAKEGT